jgi:hypothetical protein
MAGVIHSALRSALRNSTHMPTEWKWGSAAAAAAGDAILDSLQVETDGLVLDFLNDRTLVRTASVDSASTPTALLTYTAPSIKRVLGADGYLKYANHNLTLTSEGSLSASKTALTTVSTNNTAPDGGSDAALFQCTTNATNNLGLESILTGFTYKVVFYIKQGADPLPFCMVGSANGTNSARFNLTTGAVASVAGDGAGTITSVGSGWYRCVATFTTINGQAFIYFSETAGAINATAGRNAYLWGLHHMNYPVDNDDTLDDYLATSGTAKYAIPIEYNSSAVCQGALIEEARTNYVLYSESFDNGASGWTNSELGYSANQAVAPDGTTTADLITALTSSGNKDIYRVVLSGTAASGSNYAFSYYVKKGTHRYFGMSQWRSSNNVIAAVFDLDGGGSTATQTFAGATSGTIVSTSQESLGNGWYRLTLVGSATGTTLSVGIKMLGAATGNSFSVDANVNWTAAGTETGYIWGAQSELGSFATSYIKTTSATVTRAADRISLATSAFPYSATAMTLVAEIKAKEGRRWFEATVDGSNYIQSFWQSSLQLTVQSGGAGSAGLDAGTITTDVTSKIAHGLAANDYGSSIDGGAAVTDVSGAMPVGTPTSIVLGYSPFGGAGTEICGYFRTFCYRPRRVSNADLALESAA